MTSLFRKVSLIALGVLTALGILSAVPAPAMAQGERFVLISHAPDSDSWWNTIKNAIKVAGDQMEVTVEYRNPPTGDLADMARIVQQAAASNPDGIIVTIADYDVLSGPVTDAVDKGIPVITINSGTPEQSEKLGALMHIGQPEYAAGFGAGKRAKAKGVTAFLCVNHYITNPASVERCQGYADALGVELGSQMIDSGQDPSEINPTLAALEDIGRAGDIHFGTFDLSGEIAKAIKSDVIAFAIDQQPYLQGYLPVVILTNLARYGVLPSGNINSGPGFVVKSNIALVEKYAGEYR